MRTIWQYYLEHWIILTIVTIYALLLIFNSTGVSVWLPECIITSLTGNSCYGCGLNTAAIHLLRLEFSQAFQSNPLIYLYVPIIIGGFTYDFHKFRSKLNQSNNEQD